MMMFKPLPMQRVMLKVMREDAPLAALVLADCGVFSPEAADLPEDVLPERPGAQYNKVYRNAQSRLEKLRQRADDGPCREFPDELRVIELAELEQANKRLGELWGRYSELEEQQHRLLEERRHLEELKENLHLFSTLNINLGRLQASGAFLELHMGTLPLLDLQRFAKAVSIEPHHFLKVFHTARETAYVMIAGPRKEKQDTHKLLQTADFRPLALPPEFKSHPKTIQHELSAQLHECTKKILAVEQQLIEAEQRDELAVLEEILHYAAPFSALAETLRGGRSGLTLVEGWIPKRDILKLEQTLEIRFDKRFEFTARDPEESDDVPSVLSHPPFFRPFEKLVKNFGIPRYGEVDPTILFAISFILMFGMMFGDVGHGAVIGAAGWYFREKLGEFTIPITASGISSVIFGFLYGSIFGYEEILHALWMAPISDPMLMLTVAVGWGVGLILLSCSLKFINLLAEKRFMRAWFDTQGLAGILLYLGGLFGLYRLATYGVFGVTESLPIVIPLLVILGYKWHEQHGMALGERIIVVLIEGFDSIMNFVSNTLSYMRVAAFSLNHAALAIAVFTLANTMGGFGHWVTIILGNVFILVLEGAIVAIQVLRLEYYEGFARFFSGDGRVFRPLRLGPPRP
ncbi:MAG: ATPase [Gammaproteobacteria bacterium]|nr:ATPase [Gammaproteobacteria bacterium]